MSRVFFAMVRTVKGACARAPAARGLTSPTADDSALSGAEVKVGALVEV